MEKHLLTKEGLAQVKLELETLLNVTRNEVIEELQTAREQGDLSENADYDAAREKQAQIESKIKKLQYVIDNHEIIKSFKHDGVKAGDTVKILNYSTKKEEEYKIVGSFEANPFENKISHESPLALSLMNQKKGDVVKVKSKNPYKIKIIKIS